MSSCISRKSHARAWTTVEDGRVRPFPIDVIRSGSASSGSPTTNEWLTQSRSPGVVSSRSRNECRLARSQAHALNRAQVTDDYP